MEGNTLRPRGLGLELLRCQLNLSTGGPVISCACAHLCEHAGGSHFGGVGEDAPSDNSSIGLSGRRKRWLPGSMFVRSTNIDRWLQNGERLRRMLCQVQMAAMPWFWRSRPCRLQLWSFDGSQDGGLVDWY